MSDRDSSSVERDYKIWHLSKYGIDIKLFRQMCHDKWAHKRFIKYYCKCEKCNGREINGDGMNIVHKEFGGIDKICYQHMKSDSRIGKDDDIKKILE